MDHSYILARDNCLFLAFPILGVYLYTAWLKKTQRSPVCKRKASQDKTDNGIRKDGHLAPYLPNFIKMYRQTPTWQPSSQTILAPMVSPSPFGSVNACPRDQRPLL